MRPSRRSSAALAAAALASAASTSPAPVAPGPICSHCRRPLSADPAHTVCAHPACNNLIVCVFCFSVGAADKHPHQPSHPYRVVQPLSTPLYDDDWSADDEVRLLASLSSHGPNHWREIADDLNRTPLKCQSHYERVYIEGLNAPLASSYLSARPHLAHSPSNSVTPPAIPSDSPDAHPHPISSATPSAPTTNATLTTSPASTGLTPAPPTADPIPSPPPTPQIADNPPDDVRQKQQARSLPRDSPSAKPGQNTVEGFMPLRGDFDVEWDDAAEASIADLAVEPSDSEEVKAMKIRLLEIYNHRVQNREAIKAFLFDRNLLDFAKLAHPNRRSSRDEKELSARLRLFSRILKPDDYTAFYDSAMREFHISREVFRLISARSAGLRTRTEVDLYDVERRVRASRVSDSITFIPAETASSPPPPVSPAPSAAPETPIESTIDTADNDGMSIRTTNSSAVTPLATPADSARSPATPNQPTTTGGPDITENVSTPDGTPAATRRARDQRRIARSPYPLVEAMPVDGLPGVDDLTDAEKRLCSMLNYQPLDFIRERDAMLQVAFEKAPSIPNAPNTTVLTLRSKIVRCSSTGSNVAPGSRPDSMPSDVERVDVVMEDTGSGVAEAVQVTVSQLQHSNKRTKEPTDNVPTEKIASNAGQCPVEVEPLTAPENMNACKGATEESAARPARLTEPPKKILSMEEEENQGNSQVLAPSNSDRIVTAGIEEADPMDVEQTHKGDEGEEGNQISALTHYPPNEDAIIDETTYVPGDGMVNDSIVGNTETNPLPEEPIAIPDAVVTEEHIAAEVGASIDDEDTEKKDTTVSLQIGAVGPDDGASASDQPLQPIDDSANGSATGVAKTRHSNERGNVKDSTQESQTKEDLENPQPGTSTDVQQPCLEGSQVDMVGENSQYVPLSVSAPHANATPNDRDALTRAPHTTVSDDKEISNGLDVMSTKSSSLNELGVGYGTNIFAEDTNPKETNDKRDGQGESGDHVPNSSLLESQAVSVADGDGNEDRNVQQAGAEKGRGHVTSGEKRGISSSSNALPGSRDCHNADGPQIGDGLNLDSSAEFQDDQDSHDSPRDGQVTVGGMSVNVVIAAQSSNELQRGEHFEEPPGLIPSGNSEGAAPEENIRSTNLVSENTTSNFPVLTSELAGHRAPPVEDVKPSNSAGCDADVNNTVTNCSKSNLNETLAEAVNRSPSTEQRDSNPSGKDRNLLCSSCAEPLSPPRKQSAATQTSPSLLVGLVPLLPPHPLSLNKAILPSAPDGSAGDGNDMNEEGKAAALGEDDDTRKARLDTAMTDALGVEGANAMIVDNKCSTAPPTTVEQGIKARDSSATNIYDRQPHQTPGGTENDAIVVTCKHLAVRNWPDKRLREPVIRRSKRIQSISVPEFARKVHDSLQGTENTWMSVTPNQSNNEGMSTTIGRRTVDVGSASGAGPRPEALSAVPPPMDNDDDDESIEIRPVKRRRKSGRGGKFEHGPNRQVRSAGKEVPEIEDSVKEDSSIIEVDCNQISVRPVRTAAASSKPRKTSQTKTGKSGGMARKSSVTTKKNCRTVKEKAEIIISSVEKGMNPLSEVVISNSGDPGRAVLDKRDSLHAARKSTRGKLNSSGPSVTKIARRSQAAGNALKLKLQDHVEDDEESDVLIEQGRASNSPSPSGSPQRESRRKTRASKGNQISGRSPGARTNTRSNKTVLSDVDGGKTGKKDVLRSSRKGTRKQSAPLEALKQRKSGEEVVEEILEEGQEDQVTSQHEHVAVEVMDAERNQRHKKDDEYIMVVKSDAKLGKKSPRGLKKLTSKKRSVTDDDGNEISEEEVDGSPELAEKVPRDSRMPTSKNGDVDVDDGNDGSDDDEAEDLDDLDEDYLDDSGGERSDGEGPEENKMSMTGRRSTRLLKRGRENEVDGEGDEVPTKRHRGRAKTLVKAQHKTVANKIVSKTPSKVMKESTGNNSAVRGRQLKTPAKRGGRRTGGSPARRAKVGPSEGRVTRSGEGRYSLRRKAN